MVLLKVITITAHIARNVIRHIPSVRETIISGRHESITLIESIVDLVDVWIIGESLYRVLVRRVIIIIGDIPVKDAVAREEMVGLIDALTVLRVLMLSQHLVHGAPMKDGIKMIGGVVRSVGWIGSGNQVHGSGLARIRSSLTVSNVAVK
tara:strand:- start:181 stop:630 length:450 start_codon:yes stop_codon:yes gene_type:complete